MIDSDGILIPSPPRRQHKLTAQARRSHVFAFESGKLSMSAYCEKHGIPISTLSTWVTKYGKTQKAAFMPVQVKDNPPPVISPKAHPTQTKAIEIHRGDLKIVLPMVDVAMTVEIIKGVLACN